MPNILIIDDEPGIRSVLTDILEDENYTVFTAEDGYEGLSTLKAEPIDCIILDVWLPNMGGIDVLQEVKQDYPDIEIIVISGHANIDIAVKAVKLGAFDFLEKPLSLDKVITLVRNALQIETLKRENKELKNAIYKEDEFIGYSESIERIRTLIDQTASSDSRIFITGENGTGKELVAREVHQKSTRATGPFIEVNCAAIPDTLIESELFGHEKGAFTSAVSQRKGKFELADGGTLFLDEIADMSLSAQAKVLRVLQEFNFERIGGEETISVDVRVLAATNKDIQEEIRKKNFREDLYFRLNVIPMHVPPLQERKDDIPHLVSYFMNKLSQQGIQPKHLEKNAIEELKTYDWPGNIRELKNFIERINIMTQEDSITAEIVSSFLGQKNRKQNDESLSDFTDMKLNNAKDEFERRFIVQKLEENDYNISRTAEILGIYPSNLHGKIKKLGIERKK